MIAISHRDRIHALYIMKSIYLPTLFDLVLPLSMNSSFSNWPPGSWWYYSPSWLYRSPSYTRSSSFFIFHTMEAVLRPTMCPAKINRLFATMSWKCCTFAWLRTSSFITWSVYALFRILFRNLCWYTSCRSDIARFRWACFMGTGA